MSQEVHTRLRVSAVLIGLFAVIGIVFAGAPAWAHDELIGSSPAAGSEVDALPTEITLTFSGVLLDEAGATQIVVTDASGADITGGDPVLDGTKVTQPLAATPAPGVVTVVWRVVSSDGHPVSDQFTFTVGAGGAATSTATFTPLPGPDNRDIGVQGDFTWLWIVPGVVLVGAAGALVAVLMAKARGPRED